MTKSDHEQVLIAIDAFTRGEFVMVMDRLDRENECDFVLAGEACTPEKMAFMIHWSTGIICVVSDQERLEAAGLYPAAPRGNTDKNGTNFYVATDYLPTTTTGVSAADRCETVLAMCDNSKLIPSHFSKPGHMFPLCAQPNGLRDRDGHTESAYDLCRLAGMTTVSIIGEMMHHDGEMMRLGASIQFAADHGIPLITVPQLKEYAERFLPNLVQAPLAGGVRQISRCRIKVDGISDECTLLVFKPINPPPVSAIGLELEVVALVRGGDLAGAEDVAVRIHSECFTGDILSSLRCDCGVQLNTFITDVMNERPNACLLYVRGHEGRGIGLSNKVKCYQLQDDENLDTVDANLRLGFDDDLRTFEDCRAVIHALGIKSVELYTNNPEKARSLGADLVKRIVPLPSVPNGVNDSYLLTKQNRMKHQTVIDTMKWHELSAPLGVPEETRPVRVAVVSAMWNDEYVCDVVSACVAELKSSKTANIAVETLRVPGAMDLVAGVRAAVRRFPEIDAIIAVGVLIKGDTDLYTNNCSAVANALSALNTQEGMPPVISGLLMYKNEAQANARLETEESRKLGLSWARSAVSMATLFRM